MKCFYHSADLDGKCSGAIVRHEFPDCEMIGINYGQPFPWDRIEPGELIFMVDFSLPIADMKRLNELACLTWIDHHKTALEEAARESFTARNHKLEIGRAGCELTWEYLHATLQEIPRAVFLLGRYDVWRHHEHPGALEFQYGMRMHDCSPENKMLWDILLDAETDILLVDQIIDTGETLLEYERRQNDIYITALGFDVEWEGLRFIAVNKGLVSSLLFASVWDPGKYDAMLSFYRNRHGSWTVSVYTDTAGIDASAICKRHGGGGHVGAAGFQCDELPFLGGPDKGSKW